MSKVVWLEEHRVTRKAAIDNAVKLAEAELRQKMENEQDERLEQKLEEVKIIWQCENISQLQNERENWETLKNEEIMARLEEEKQKWRQTVLIPELESEHQKWAKELEQRPKEEKECWKEVETEKLKWTSHWEHQLQEEKDSWVKHILEPTLKKLKLEAEETLKIEKEKLRCMELEIERLKVLQDSKHQLSQERQKWNDPILMTLEKEKQVWNKNMEEGLKTEKAPSHKTLIEKLYEMEKKTVEQGLLLDKWKRKEKKAKALLRDQQAKCEKYKVDNLELRDKLEKVMQSQEKLQRSSVEENDERVKVLRSQYLDTVAKIKGDVLRHVTETTMHAAETVKIEVDKERMFIFNQIKEFYKSKVTDILETKIINSVLKDKLQAVEKILETLSSNASSMSTTPRFDDINVDEHQVKLGQDQQLEL